MTARILFIARELTAGGAAYLAVRHLDQLAESHHVDLLVTGPVSDRVASMLPESVVLQHLDVGREPLARGLLATRETMAGSHHPCLTKRYNAVVGTSLFPDLAACAAFSLCRGQRKLLVLLDEGLIQPGRAADVRAAMQQALVAADHLLPVSRGLLDALAHEFPVLSEIPFTVIPPPIDAPAADRPSPFIGPDDAGLPRVVTVARLSPEKQLRRCLQVQRRLRDRGIHFRWHVVGEGSDRPAIERQITALRMADRFHLEGFQADPRAWMRHADLFVLCSRSEGCPTVIREALAEGTPVLSTDVNGARELIADGITGVVVPDSETEFTAALGRLIADASLRHRLRGGLVAAGPTPPPGHETRQLVDCLSRGPRQRPAPTVTIVIPAYNHATFIDRAIHSALMQDYPALEVVVCDDASTDETGVIADRWSHDPRFRLCRRAVNLGRVANYRRAVEEDAHGEWVLMLDGDDHLIDPSFVTRAMQVAATHADVHPLFVQAGHRVVRQEPSGSVTPDRPFVDVLPNIPGDSLAMAGSAYLAFVYETGFFTHLGTLYRRSAALRQGFYTSDISSADMDSLLRLALSGHVVVMKSIAGCWVQHGNNTSSNLPLERIAENVQIFRRIAREGAATGVIDMHRIDRCLTRYEARTLAHLFGTTVGTSARGLAHALQMMVIIARVNPRVCLEPELAAAWWRVCKRLAAMSLKRLAARVLPRPALRGGQA